MKRFLAYLILLCFAAACTPATSSGPTERSDAPAPRTADAEHGFDDKDAAPVTASRFAKPPAGVVPADEPAQEWREAPPTTTHAEAERSRQAPSPTPAADKPARSSSPDTMSVEAGSGRAGALANESADAARPLAKKANRAEDERPGLGTSWGESRASLVYEAPFERDSYSPSYTATLNYNDRRGASALAGNSAYPTYASIGMSSALTISLRDRSGTTLSAYRGNGRTVAVGENGQRYTIVVQNNTNERFEVVLSVDGLDVLDGEDASYNKRGYLIDAYGTLEIEGFRQSADAVAAFRFGSVSDSYAARTGSARNVGVIGAAAFGERGYASRLRAYQERLAAQRYNQRDIERRRNADPFPAKWAEPPHDPLTIAR